MKNNFKKNINKKIIIEIFIIILFFKIKKIN